MSEGTTSLAGYRAFGQLRGTMKLWTIVRRVEGFERNKDVLFHILASLSDMT